MSLSPLHVLHDALIQKDAGELWASRHNTWPSVSAWVLQQHRLLLYLAWVTHSLFELFQQLLKAKTKPIPVGTESWPRFRVVPAARCVSPRPEVSWFLPMMVELDVIFACAPWIWIFSPVGLCKPRVRDVSGTGGGWRRLVHPIPHFALGARESFSLLKPSAVSNQLIFISDLFLDLGKR